MIYFTTMYNNINLLYFYNYYIFSYDPKRVIVREGHVPMCFYFILSGSGLCSVVVDFLFIVTPIVGVCNCSCFVVR